MNAKYYGIDNQTNLSLFLDLLRYAMEVSRYAMEVSYHILKLSALFLSPFTHSGIGYAMVAVSFLCTIYYNVVIAWVIYFIYSSINREVPWKSCKNKWNTPSCSEGARKGLLLNIFILICLWLKVFRIENKLLLIYSKNTELYDMYYMTCVKDIIHTYFCCFNYPIVYQKRYLPKFNYSLFIKNGIS